MKRLANKFALITGGSSGIGLETARQFVVEGATVAITGRNETALAAVKDELGDSLLTICSDAANIDDQRSLAAQLKTVRRRLDILFINAADVTHAPIEKWDELGWDRLLATNLKGPFFLIQSLLPILANPSSVILCGSAAVHIGLSTSSVYAASKAGLLSLATSLSAEFLERGIRINGLSPGPIDTPAMKKLGLAPEEEETMLEEILNLVPLGRLGTPGELAKAAVFLASDESSFILGTELIVDGGTSNL